MTNIADAVQVAFERIHQDSFRGDPAINAHLKVEVVEGQAVDGADTVILITPWTLNGLVFADEFPDTLSVNGRETPVFTVEVDGVGSFYSVNLVPDVSSLQSPEAARSIAHSFAEHFRKAVERALDGATVADTSRRRLLKGKPEG